MKGRMANKGKGQQGSESFFSLGGTLPLASPSYILRSADEDLVQVLESREHALVLDSRQKGKSSLITRAAARLQEQGWRTIKLDLQRFGSTLTSDQWYSSLILAGAQQLDPDDDSVLDSLRHSKLPRSQEWIARLLRESLEGSKGLVVFVDEVDFVRSLPFSTDEFFGLIRSATSESPSAERRLVFCFCGASTPAALVRDPGQGQAITGRRILLQDFQPDEISPYGPVLSADPTEAAEVLRSVYSWTSGHPYLTQLACHEWLRRKRAGSASVDGFFSSQLQSFGSPTQSDHLLSISQSLLRPSLPGLGEEEAKVRALETLLRLHRRPLPAASLPRDLCELLLFSGVAAEKQGHLHFRCRLYREAFHRGWITDQLPQAELRRRRAAAWKAGLLASAVGGAVIVLLLILLSQSATLARVREATLIRSQAQKAAAEKDAYIGAMQAASSELDEGNPMSAAAIVESLSSSPHRGWEWRHAARLLSGWVHEEKAEEPPFSWTFDSEDRPATISFRSHTHILKPHSVQPSSVPHPEGSYGPVSCPGFTLVRHPGGTLVFSPGRVERDRRAILWKSGNSLLVADPERGEVYREDSQGRSMSVKAPEAAKGFLLPGGRRAVVQMGMSLSVVDFALGREVFRFSSEEAVSKFVSSPDGRLLFAATDSPGLRRYDLVGGKELPPIPGNEGPIRSVALSSDGRLVATAGGDGVVRVYDADSGRLLHSHLGHKGRVQEVLFAPKTGLLWSGSTDSALKAWRPTGGPRPQALGTRGLGPVRIRSLPQFGVLLSAFEDGTVRLLGPDSRPLLTLASPRKVPIISAAVLPEEADPKGRRVGFLAALTQEGTLLWKGASSSSLALGAPARAIQPCGPAEVAVGFESGEIRRVRLTTGASSPLRPPWGRLNTMTWSQASRLLLAGFADGKVEIWDPSEGRLIRRIEAPTGAIGLDLCPVSSRFTVCLNSGDILLGDLKASDPPRVLKGHATRVWRAPFSPDGTKIASCSFDGTARVWDVRTGQPLHVIQLKSWVGEASFSPDGGRLATACGDGTVKLWSVDTGRLVYVVHRSDGPMFTSVFTPNGRWLASSNSHGELLLWDGG